MTDTTNHAPFAELADTGGDYTLSFDLRVDFEDDRRGPDRREPFIGSFEIAAGRCDGRWYLMVSPTTTDEYGDIQNAGAPVVDLRDQTADPDPRALLRALLTGQTA